MEYPRPQDVATGVAWFAARTPTLPPATHTNSYALGTRQLLLVEPATPYEDEITAWLAWARELASSGREAIAVFATHHHPDHVSEALCRELGLPLWAHVETASRLPVPVERRLDDGDVIALDGPTPQRWECLHTPGHAPGHLCLLERDANVVVVGDMVASEGTILIDPIEGDLAEYLRQLERLAALDAALALPAHGAPISQPTAHFRHYIRHRGGREAKVVAALGASPRTLDDLLPLVYDDTPRAIWPIARLSLESHLIKLEREGRARREGDGWRGQ
jgi:glyoxylase-like metal-dependent hydrolase (beta-lactamase superfamily II)